MGAFFFVEFCWNRAYVRTMRRLFLFSLFCFASCSSTLLAQRMEMEFRRLSLKEGLSQSVVNAIVRDNQGYMWFATQDGLNRYDGYAFKVYRHDLADSTSLPDNFIWRLLRSRKGELWIGTFKGGLGRYNPASDNFSSYQNDPGNSSSLSSNNVTAVYDDPHGILWVGTWFGGLNRFDPSDSGAAHFTHHRYNSGDSGSLSDDRVSAVIEDVRGDLWVGTWNGLNKLDHSTGRFTRYLHKNGDPHSLSNNMIWSMCEDQAGDLWIATWGGGLSRYDRSVNNFTNYKHNPQKQTSLSGDLLRCVYVDSKGVLWVGTYDAGLNRFDRDRGTFVRYRNDPNNPQSLPEDEIQSIFEDNTGSLWVGTGYGIATYDLKREKFRTYRHHAGIPGTLTHQRIQALHADRSGGLWIGTLGGGLSYRSRGSESFVQYRHKPEDPRSISSDVVMCVYEQSTGDIWVGSRGGGLDRLDRRTGRCTHFRNDPSDPRSLSSNAVETIHETHDGSLWIGTSGGGLERFDTQRQQFVHYRLDPSDTTSLSGNTVWSLFEDSRGSLWVGTWGADLNRLDQGRNAFIRYRHGPHDPTSLVGNTIQCVGEDQQGNLWFGTSDGLSRYDYATNRFTRYTEKDGLPNNSVTGILVDRTNNIWLSTNRGLSRFDPRKGTFKNFDASDGLQADEFNQGAFARGPDGTLYFGGISGINAFDPDSIRDNPFVPPIVITRFKVFEELRPFTQSRSNQITLSYQESFFSFEYAALDFTAPEKNQYAYKLDGLDKDWVYAGMRRYASYTHVDPGEYAFHVKGTNNDGVWNEQGTMVYVTIIPPYWNTWWFRVLVVAVLAGILFAFARYRLNKLLEIERTRNRIARDLHDEVSATLSGINYFAQAISSDTGNAVTPVSQKFLALIHESATEVQESMSDIIWSINPENDDWERVLAKFRRYASDLFDSKGIRYTIEMPATIPSVPLSMERRRHIWLMYKEMVTNVARHSSCSEASVIITMDQDKSMHIVVADNGKGFDPKTPTERNGNKNIHTRALAVGASIHLQTAHGKGTRWELNFSL
ncbi:MAG TPA: histidine kinase [Bacteroidetes bacterium]|nr:histidine kinase [Bacteroidota bacterium]